MGRAWPARHQQRDGKGSSRCIYLRRIALPLPAAVSVLIVAGATGPISGAQASTAAAPHSMQAAALNIPSGASDTSSGLRAGSLTAEHLTDPLGIDTGHPRLGWVIMSPGRGVMQAAYQIRVAESPAGLQGGGVVWDSGKVSSGQSSDVQYAGPSLQSRTRYYWDVRVWDNHGNVSAWSEPAWFETAFLSPGEFHGAWIGSPRSSLSLDGASWIWYPEGNPAQSAPAATRYFRRTVDLPGQPTGAQFLLTADDQFVLYVNGQEVAHSSGQSDAWRQATQVDLTRDLHSGANTIAVADTNTGGPASWIGKLDRQAAPRFR